MAGRDLPLYAVLIDGDNISFEYAGAILNEVTSFAEPALRKVYGDWRSDNLNGWRNILAEHGLVAHQEQANTSNKNATDIGMVIDAMDILHGGRLDGFVIVSSDSDFTRLASRIREHGLGIVGMGERKAPKSFVKNCQRFIFLENLESEPSIETGSDSSPNKKQNDSEKTEPKKENPTKAIPIIKRAMTKIDADGEWFVLGLVGNYVLKDEPEFDSRTYGASKFSDLIEKLKNDFELRRNSDRDFEIRRKKP